MGQMIDIIILAICTLFAVRAFFRGFLLELFSLLAFIAGYYAAATFGLPFWKIIQNIFTTLPNYMIILPYIIIFLFTYIVIKILESQLSKIINLILLTGLNRILGIVFGLFEGVVLVYVLVQILTKQDIITNINFDSIFSNSKLIGYINEYKVKFLG